MVYIVHKTIKAKSLIERILTNQIITVHVTVRQVQYRFYKIRKGLGYMSRGWRSNYDRSGQSNVEKLAGRVLHVQDINWNISVFFLIIAIPTIVFLLRFGGVDLSFSGFRMFIDNLNSIH